MFTVTLLEFKTNQAELHRQAAKFRLMQLLKKTKSMDSPCIHRGWQIID